MKDLIKQKHTYIIKEIFTCLLIIFILVFYYYICICIYNFAINHDNDQLTTLYIINIEELKPVNKNPANIWYKCLIDDFFKKFTSNSKTINYKIIEVKSDCVTKTLIPLELELEHNINRVKNL